MHTCPCNLTFMMSFYFCSLQNCQVHSRHLNHHHTQVNSRHICPQQIQVMFLVWRWVFCFVWLSKVMISYVISCRHHSMILFTLSIFITAIWFAIFEYTAFISAVRKVLSCVIRVVCTSSVIWELISLSFQTNVLTEDTLISLQSSIMKRTSSSCTIHKCRAFVSTFSGT